MALTELEVAFNNGTATPAEVRRHLLTAVDTDRTAITAQPVKKASDEAAASYRSDPTNTCTLYRSTTPTSQNMSKYFPPTLESKAFNCVYCGVYSAQVWSHMLRYNPNGNDWAVHEFQWCWCGHCKKVSYWYDGKMIIPTAAPVAPAHPDLPENCQADFDEARDVVGRSPKAAAALMRLVLQKLMVDLGEKGKNINDDIASLVAKGLPVVVQQALDYCRVVGNNSVHPGEINLNDTPEIAHSLFEMVNFIVEDRITRPKQVQALYGKLPQGAREAIEKRDSPSAAGAK